MYGNDDDEDEDEDDEDERKINLQIVNRLILLPDVVM